MGSRRTPADPCHHEALFSTFASTNKKRQHESAAHHADAPGRDAGFGNNGCNPGAGTRSNQAQQLQIRSDVTAGTDRYKDMPASTRTELLSRQDRLLRMIGDKHDPTELTKDQRLEAFNTLEWMEATINETEGERMVCAREPKIGSHQVATVCRTQQQIDQAHDRARRQTSEGSMALDI